MPSNTYRLRVNPSSHYSSLFDESNIVIQPGVGGQRPRPEAGVVTIGAGDLEFEILLPAVEGRVPPSYISAAKSVLSQIVDMDEAARALPDTIDHDEILAFVVVHDDCVEFHYFATTVNTEWSVYFTRRADRWEYRGFKRPQ